MTISVNQINRHVELVSTSHQKERKTSREALSDNILFIKNDIRFADERQLIECN